MSVSFPPEDEHRRYAEVRGEVWAEDARGFWHRWDPGRGEWGPESAPPAGVEFVEPPTPQTVPGGRGGPDGPGAGSDIGPVFDAQRQSELDTRFGAMILAGVSGLFGLLLLVWNGVVPDRHEAPLALLLLTWGTFALAAVAATGAGGRMLGLIVRRPQVVEARRWTTAASWARFLVVWTAVATLTAWFTERVVGVIVSAILDRTVEPLPAAVLLGYVALTVPLAVAGRWTVYRRAELRARRTAAKADGPQV